MWRTLADKGEKKGAEGEKEPRSKVWPEIHQYVILAEVAHVDYGIRDVAVVARDPMPLNPLWIYPQVPPVPESHQPEEDPRRCRPLVDDGK
jgi:hypothetical protein